MISSEFLVGLHIVLFILGIYITRSLLVERTNWKRIPIMVVSLCSGEIFSYFVTLMVLTAGGILGLDIDQGARENAIGAIALPSLALIIVFATITIQLIKHKEK